MSDHSQLFSPSKAERRINCPGSARLEAGLPDQKSAYAEEGSAAHALAEICLRRGEDAAKYSGRRIARAGEGWSILQPGTKRTDGYEVVANMTEAVQTYLDYVRGLSAGAEVMIEKRFKLADDVWGTADHIAAVPFGPLYVSDYKHGQGVPVDPEWNAQALTYALGAVYSSPYDHDQVVVSIIQPRCREGAPIKTWALPIPRLYQWRDEILLPGIDACRRPDAPLVPGAHCKFCKAQGGCPAIHKEVAAVMPLQAEAALPNPGLMTNDQLGAILDKREMAESWLKEVYSLAMRRVEAGEIVRGADGAYKVVEGRGSRDWADEGKAKGYLIGALKEGAYEYKLLSPAKAEAAFKAAGKNPKELGPLIIEKPGNPALAPANDKRLALPTSAQRAFAGIDIG